MGCPYEAGLEGERGGEGGGGVANKQKKNLKIFSVFCCSFSSTPPPPGPQGLRPVGASLTTLSFFTITPYPRLACWRKPLHASLRSCT